MDEPKETDVPMGQKSPFISSSFISETNPLVPFTNLLNLLMHSMAKTFENSFSIALLTFYGFQTLISMLTKVHTESNPHSHTLLLSNTLYVDFFL
jgi:hypothetical protein